jgi:hypothetical protein
MLTVVDAPHDAIFHSRSRTVIVIVRVSISAT